MIDIIEITKRFNVGIVLDECTLKVADGEICGLIGVNGCGKSTLMKILCGLAFADGGEARCFNKDGGEARIGYMIEGPAFCNDLTARGNMDLFATLFDGVGPTDVDAVLKAVGLGSVLRTKYGNFSLGMKQRLYFAYSMLDKPDILVLDEVFNGIDPVSVSVFKTLIKNFAAAGGTVLISGHNLDQLQSLCDRICIMSGGKVAYESLEPASENLEEAFIRIAGSGVNVC